MIKWADADLDAGLDIKQYTAMITAAFDALDRSDFFKKLPRSQPGGAIKRLFSSSDTPSDVIGMKTNCLTRQNATPVALVEALAQILSGAGFDENNVIIWERTSWELGSAGYKLNASFSGRRCIGTDANGIGYSDDFYSSGQVSSLVSRFLTDMVNHNINVPVLKDHWLAGLSAGLKNMYGSIHNPNKYHDNNCSPFCAHINNLEPVRGTHRCTVMDAVNVQYNGGPGYAGQYMSAYGGLIISEDPVACDRIGLEVVNHLRKQNGLPVLARAGRPVRYLDDARDLGLGESELDKIDLRVVMIDSLGEAKEGELF